jgi:hypothetical protein
MAKLDHNAMLRTDNVDGVGDLSPDLVRVHIAEPQATTP